MFYQIKKIILIIFLSFFISSISYSKIISFNNCYKLGDNANYDSKINHKKTLEKNTFEVDILKKQITHIMVFSNDYLKRYDHLKDELDKSKITTWGLEYMDNNYINGANYERVMFKVDYPKLTDLLINIKEKTIEIKGKKVLIKYQCE
jgi:hypothetical protein